MPNLKGEDLIDFAKALKKKDSDDARDKRKRASEMLDKVRVHKSQSEAFNSIRDKFQKAMKEQDVMYEDLLDIIAELGNYKVEK